MTDMNVQKANEKSFFGKNMNFKKFLQNRGTNFYLQKNVSKRLRF